jgi:RNA-directed DNA polymerase
MIHCFSNKINYCNNSEAWLDLPWKKFQRNVYRLQKRIYKASQNCDQAKVLKLQRLMLSSHQTRMLAIRQVTQLNAGKKSAGIDRKLALTNAERFALEKKLSQEAKRWQHQPLLCKKMPIPKSHVVPTMRTLKILTISDRAWQCLIKMILEPAHEAHFDERSYGFRPPNLLSPVRQEGRDTHDAQKYLFLNLSSQANGKDKKVIELNMEKCFDRIHHQTILDLVIAPTCIKACLKQCLKLGAAFVGPSFGSRSDREQGIPQGGTINSLLVNIVLNGIEQIHPSIRYADNMVFFLKPKDSANEVLDKIKAFLKTRGLNISQKKTKMTATTTGFDFLGWHFKVLPDGRFRSTPSKKNYKNVIKKIKAVVNNSAIGVQEKSKRLALIIRGWRNYHKQCNMDNHRLWHCSYSTWKQFIKQASLNRYDVNQLIKKAFPSVSSSEHKFVNV